VKRDVTYYIRRLLYRYDCVIVPDLGGFVGSYQSARILSAIQTIKPPYKKISFNIHLNNNDGLLANEIAYGEGIDYEAARDVIHKFVDDCIKRMARGEAVRLEHIGDLFYDEEQNLQYKSVHDTNYLKSSYGLSSMRLEKMAQVKNKPEEVKKLVPIRERETPVVQEDVIQPAAKTSNFNWKVAAVLIPLIGLLGYGYLERSELNDLYHQYSRLGIYIFDRQEQYEAREGSDLKEFPEEAETPWFESLVESEVEASESAENTTDEVAEESGNTSPEEVSSKATELVYHVVAGCFGEADNAVKLEKSLKDAGYTSAHILETAHKGLTVVAYHSFASVEEARKELQKVKQDRQPDAWLLKK